MDQTLKQAKQGIRGWIRYFSDQRLAEVYAFNADGKMKYSKPCCCILGVTLAEELHESGCGNVLLVAAGYMTPRHYGIARMVAGAPYAETAYRDLVWPSKQLDALFLHRPGDCIMCGSAFSCCFPYAEESTERAAHFLEVHRLRVSSLDQLAVNQQRQRRMSPILRAEMRRRDRLKAATLYQQKVSDTEALTSHAMLVSA